MYGGNPQGDWWEGPLKVAVLLALLTLWYHIA